MNTIKKLNFNFINEFEYGLLGGLTYAKKDSYQFNELGKVLKQD